MLAENDNSQKNVELHRQLIASQAELTFRNNMQYFKLRNPAVYNLFKDYSPSQFKLFIDARGFLNIEENGNPVCNEDPYQIAKMQVNTFRQKRQVLRAEFNNKRTKPEETRFEHTQAMNRISDEVNEYRKTRPDHKDLPPYMTLVTVLGVGFGHHITELIRMRDIRSLYIFEPETDVFYASLHTVDWVEIMEYFEPSGKSLDLKIGGTPESFCNHLVTSVTTSGIYRISWIYLYQSANSPTLDQSVHLLKKNIHRIAQGWGFFDDELISIAHGASHAATNRSWIKRNKDLEQYKDIPVFIVGSGPSIDDQLEFIKENQGKALVFSGGTALKTLKAAGIEPDFHVEVERIFAAYELLAETLADGDFGKNTILLANNTVHPKVFELFKNAGIAQKNNDAGSSLMARLFEVPKEDELEWGKPSCINGAFVFACMLGFKQIYMFGCDCGFKDPENHHSKLSDYYDEKGTDKRDYARDYEKNIVIDGNFGGEIKSTAYLDMGRMTLEQARARYPNVEAFNCSDGALIKGFKPQPINEIELDKTIDDKNKFSLSVLNDHFHDHQCDEDKLAEVYKHDMQRFHRILDELRKPLETAPQDAKEAIKKLMDMDKVLLDRLIVDNVISIKLLNGSLRTLQTMLAGIAQETPDSALMRKYFSASANIVIEFIETMRGLTTNRFPKLDDYSWDHVRNRVELEKKA